MGKQLYLLLLIFKQFRVYKIKKIFIYTYIFRYFKKMIQGNSLISFLEHNLPERACHKKVETLDNFQTIEK